jgi:hypothetical protein
VVLLSGGVEMDALEELKRVLDKYKRRGVTSEWRFGVADSVLCTSVERHLLALIAELEARRAAMGEDITTGAGFSGNATETLK